MMTFVAGHKGMVGSALVRALETRGWVQTCDTLDLIDQAKTRDYFQKAKFDHVYIAAAKVGGIHANNAYPADFIYRNLMIEANVVEAAHRSGVKQLLFLGSSCIYPRLASQPMTEEALLSGPMEPTNEPYAIAKIAGIKLCESFNRQHSTDFRSVMPTNLYGPGDNFNLIDSHVVPALLRKMHEAKKEGKSEVEIWGTGTARREFLHVDDLAAACLFVMDLDKAAYDSVTEPRRSFLNVGAGTDMSIRELAETTAAVVGFTGRLRFDDTKPDGPPRKLLDVGRLTKLGWRPKISFEQGLYDTYKWFMKNEERARK
ncbi:MAG: GDP-L-fucose synthase [Candidatus Nanopelagicaceae bacterium]|nr:GDP-L-fucose synthase [Candidatus Nanopelagicaceae bacterium]